MKTKATKVWDKLVAQKHSSLDHSWSLLKTILYPEFLLVLTVFIKSLHHLKKKKISLYLHNIKNSQRVSLEEHNTGIGKVRVVRTELEAISHCLCKWTQEHIDSTAKEITF